MWVNKQCLGWMVRPAFGCSLRKTAGGTPERLTVCITCTLRTETFCVATLEFLKSIGATSLTMKLGKDIRELKEKEDPRSMCEVSGL